LSKTSQTASKLFLLFFEISKGYAKRSFEGKDIYIKHLGINEKSFFDYRYQEFFKHATESGIATEEEALKKAIEEGFWSDEDERQIDNSKNYIDRLVATRKSLFKTLEINAINEQITEERNKLRRKINERREILGKTAEEYASNRSNDYVIYESFYRDEALTKRFFSQNEFEDISYEELIGYILFYNEYMTEMDESNLQKIVLADFFNIYFLVLETPTEFFGKPMIELTDFQARLIIYGKIFKNIFENTPNIPDNIRQDPEALLQYVDKTKAKERFDSKKKNNEKASAEMVFGATKEELPAGAEKGKSLNQIMREKKVMNMEELMKLHGEA
jgi:hypothetical protein